MWRCIAITLVFLTVLWTAAPLLACTMRDFPMTMQERECCKHMAQMCGSTNMPQSHSCCNKELRSLTMFATSDQHSVPHLQLVAVVVTAVRPRLSEWSHETKHPYPPGESLLEPTVLRI